MLRIERHALVVGVRPERRSEYLELHRQVWPQVEQTLRDAHVTNYSIFNVATCCSPTTSTSGTITRPTWPASRPIR